MDIIYEDSRIVVAIKPSGILSTDEPGGAPDLLRQQLQTPCIRTVHRLDAAVSGIMVFARSVKAASLLSEQIRNHTFSKQYLAVIHGTPSAQQGTFEDLLGRDTKRRITYVAEAPGPGIQEASLSYELLETNGGFSLVRITLHTGRTHQIRIQFSSRGLPLVGDRKYEKDTLDCPIALWSHAIAFRHPQTDEALSFKASPPAQYPWNLFSTI